MCTLFTITIKSEVWIISNCLGLGHETMVHIAMFLLGYALTPTAVQLNHLRKQVVNQ